MPDAYVLQSFSAVYSSCLESKLCFVILALLVGFMSLSSNTPWCQFIVTLWSPATLGLMVFAQSHHNLVCCCATQLLGAPVWGPHLRYVSYEGRG